MHSPYNPSCHAGSSSSSCFYSKLQMQIINTQRMAVPQRFTDMWFCLQSEATDLNLGMEQEVRFQNSKINPPRGGNETRILSLRYSLKADGSMESALWSKPHCLCGPETLCPAFQLLEDGCSYSPWYQLLLHQNSQDSCWASKLWVEKNCLSYWLIIVSFITAKASDTLPQVELAPSLAPHPFQNKG